MKTPFCALLVSLLDLILYPIYRVSGSAADVGRLKKAFEVNPYEAEQLLKDVDIHSVAGTLKLYLREMPESLVTTPIYQKMFEAFSTIPSHDMEAKKTSLLNLFSQVSLDHRLANVLAKSMVRGSKCFYFSTKTTRSIAKTIYLSSEFSLRRNE